MFFSPKAHRSFARCIMSSYKLSATTESILYPSIYVTHGYPDNLMPKVYGTKLSGLALDKMVEYLAEFEEGKEPPPLN